MGYDIGAVLETYGCGPIHPRAGWTPIRCPFHEDRNASAAVHGTENRFHCFVCGIHEDAIGLVMEREHVGFQDAKRQVEEITGQSSSDVREQSDLGGWFPERKRNSPRVGRQVGAWRGGLAAALS